MAWTARLDRLDLENGKWSVNIMYSDGVTDIAEGYTLESVSKKSLRNLARREAKRLFDAPTSDVDIPIGTEIDVTPDPAIPPTPPTQAEIDRTSWFDDYRKLRSMTQLAQDIPALLTAQKQTVIDNLKISLKAAWKNSYLDGI